MFELFKAGWILINCQSFYGLTAEKKKYFESDSNDIVPLFLYCYSCGVDFPSLKELERLLKLYGNCAWCERLLMPHYTYSAFNAELPGHCTASLHASILLGGCVTGHNF